MNSILLRNLVCNLAVAALVITALGTLNFSASALLGFFCAAGLVGIVCRDYRQPRTFSVAPANVCSRPTALIVA